MAPQVLGEIKLFGGAALLYAAGRAAAQALAGQSPAPGRRAIAHASPIAAAAAVAVNAHDAALTSAIIFASSVASLSLVAGFIALLGCKESEPPTWPAPARKAAAMLVPACVLTVLAGLAGRWVGLNAAVMLAFGLVLVWVWREPAEETQAAHGICPRFSVFAIALLAVGAWGAITGIETVCTNMDLPAPAVVATLALSPLLVGPILLGGSQFAQRGQVWSAHATAIGFVQVNLCFVLPAAAIGWRLAWHEPLVFPIANWRVESFLLVLLSIAILPFAAGRWRPGKIEGFLALVLYAAYIVAVIAVSANS